VASPNKHKQTKQTNKEGSKMTIKQAELLKIMALKLYSVDAGTMYECFSASDYEGAIAEHGTARMAWKEHLKTLEAQRECGGYYERDNGEF
jgi:hypothetical protein